MKAQNSYAKRQGPVVLIVGDLIDTHLPELSEVAQAHGTNCTSFGDFLSGNRGDDPWQKAREHIDSGGALFVHLCHRYCKLSGTAAAGLAMYALARGGKVALMYDPDMTVWDSANFESIFNALGWHAHRFITPDATPEVLKHYLAHTSLFRE